MTRSGSGRLYAGTSVIWAREAVCLTASEARGGEEPARGSKQAWQAEQ